MNKEELISRVLNEVIKISKKYSCDFVFSIFPHSLILEDSSIILVDDLTRKEKNLGINIKGKELCNSTRMLCNEIVEALEKYQEEYQQIAMATVTPYLSGEVMSYSSYCPMEYKIFCKDLSLDRNKSGAWLIKGNNEVEKIEVQKAMTYEKLNSKKKEVLLFFSGGRDSMLCACRLIKQGYYVTMISFDNGYEVGIENIESTASRLISRYGSGCCRYLGSYYMGDMKQSLQYYFDNTGLKKMYDTLGHIDFNQIQCMTCRSAMYMAGIILCKKYDINLIAEGARKCQLFAIEQPVMIDEYKKLLGKYDIDLLLPVYDLESDWERRLELQDSGFLPKTLEAVCTIGQPMSGELTDKELDIHKAAYQKKILPSINTGLNILLNNK